MKDLQKTKEYAQNISLSKEEKLDMLKNIQTYANQNPIRSPYYSIFLKHSVAYIAMITLIIGTTATSFAAEQSLPGELLYPVKINVNEKIAQSFAFSDEQKAEVAVQLVDKRLSELEQMIIEDKDTPENVATIIDKLEDHKEELEEIQLEDSETSTETVSTYVALESMIDTHIDIIQNLLDEDSITTEVASVQSKKEEIKDDKKDGISTLAKTGEAKPEVLIDKTQTASTTNEVSTNQESQDSTIIQVLDFSEEVNPLIDSAKSKKDLQNSEAEKVKNSTREETINKVEKKLDITIDTDSNSTILNIE